MKHLGSNDLEQLCTFSLKKKLVRYVDHILDEKLKSFTVQSSCVPYPTKRRAGLLYTDSSEGTGTMQVPNTERELTVVEKKDPEVHLRLTLQCVCLVRKQHVQIYLVCVCVER